MKLGIMQPYTFPYIGYFQQINLVDRFVVYDDVSYIKQGWINRNRILLNGRDFIFTVPLKDASSFRNINETEINHHLYDGWRSKFMKTMVQAYSKAPHFQEVMTLTARVFDTRCQTISELARISIHETAKYIGIGTEICDTSAGYGNNDLKAQERVIDICKKEGASTYVNPIGGRELYSRDYFAKQGLELFFIKCGPVQYRQFGDQFVPSLSILDVMMFNTPAEIRELLRQFILE